MWTFQTRDEFYHVSWIWLAPEVERAFCGGGSDLITEMLKSFEEYLQLSRVVLAQNGRIA